MLNYNSGIRTMNPSKQLQMKAYCFINAASAHNVDATVRFQWLHGELRIIEVRHDHFFIYSVLFQDRKKNYYDITRDEVGQPYFHMLQ